LEATSLPVHLLVVLQDFPAPEWPYLRHLVVLQVPKHTPFADAVPQLKREAFISGENTTG